jgi:flagellar biosynthesis/type III secretory pathway protein FliH
VSLFEEGQGEVDRIVADAYAERDKLLGEMEPKILRLALDIAEKIVGYELDQDNDAFVSLVTAALNVMQQESRVTLRIGAEQHTRAFRSKASGKFKTDRGTVEADIIADPGAGPGGCLIETGSGAVDASVPAQLEQISRNLGLE